MESNGSSPIHNSLPPVSILNQTNSVHTLPPHILKVHFNIILSPIPMSSKWSPSFKFNHQNPVCLSRVSHTCYLPFWLIWSAE